MNAVQEVIEHPAHYLDTLEPSENTNSAPLIDRQRSLQRLEIRISNPLMISVFGFIALPICQDNYVLVECHIMKDPVIKQAISRSITAYIECRLLSTQR